MSAPGRASVGTTAHIRAQAKVNLFLRILAREASGYHGLETLFARLDLADEITVRTGGETRSIDCGCCSSSASMYSAATVRITTMQITWKGSVSRPRSAAPVPNSARSVAASRSRACARRIWIQGQNTGL